MGNTKHLITGLKNKSHELQYIYYVCNMWAFIMTFEHRMRATINPSGYSRVLASHFSKGSLSSFNFLLLSFFGFALYSPVDSFTRREPTTVQRTASSTTWKN